MSYSKKEHKYRALHQQDINPAGDCGACCLAGITGKSVKEIYDLLGRIDGMTYGEMTYGDIISMLNRLNIHFENYLPSYVRDSENPEWFTFGKPSWWNFIAWFNLSWRRINSGYVGIAMVNIHGNAHNDDFTNHYVLIYGLDWKSDNAADKIVLVSCPTKGEYAVDAKTFLKKYGGYNTIWVKPLI